MADAPEPRRTLAAELGIGSGAMEEREPGGQLGKPGMGEKERDEVLSTDSQIAGVDPAGHPPCHCSRAKLLTNMERHHQRTKQQWQAKLPRWQGGPDAGCWLDTRSSGGGEGPGLRLAWGPALQQWMRRWVVVFLHFAGPPTAGCNGCSGTVQISKGRWGPQRRTGASAQRRHRPSRRADTRLVVRHTPARIASLG